MKERERRWRKERGTRVAARDKDVTQRVCKYVHYYNFGLLFFFHLFMVPVWLFVRSALLCCPKENLQIKNSYIRIFILHFTWSWSAFQVNVTILLPKKKRQCHNFGYGPISTLVPCMLSNKWLPCLKHTLCGFLVSFKFYIIKFTNWCNGKYAYLISTTYKWTFEFFEI